MKLIDTETRIQPHDLGELYDGFSLKVFGRDTNKFVFGACPEKAIHLADHTEVVVRLQISSQRETKSISGRG